jgi:hypothetical protein
VLSSTTWYHVSVTYNNGSPKIYINGVLDASSSQTLTPASSYYGNDIGRLGFGMQYFNGRIGDVEVYNRALSPSEVYQNFNALKNRYGFIDIVNEGESGGSITRIIRKTYEYIIKNKKDIKETLFIFEIPPGWRDEYYSNKLKRHK